MTTDKHKEPLPPVVYLGRLYGGSIAECNDEYAEEYVLKDVLLDKVYEEYMKIANKAGNMHIRTQYIYAAEILQIAINRIKCENVREPTP